MPFRHTYSCFRRVRLAQTVFRYEGNGLFWSARPNRSLTSRGRRLWVGLIAANAVLVSVMAIAIGAWPILPFASLEVLLVVTAFAVVARHDEDYELLELVQDRFRWQSRDGSNSLSIEGNVAWMRVEWCTVGTTQRQHLRLSYAGQNVLLGAGLTDRDMINLAAGLAQMPTLAASLKQAKPKA